MDEYIKREDALDAVLFALVGTGHQSKAIYAIRDVHTADVVPKSEVEKLQTEVKRAIIIEIAEKLKFSNQIFKDCACNLVSPNYVDGRCDAYSEFIDILNYLVGKHLLEVKDENT